MISARIVADSINTAGNRLTTMVLTMHRMILAEFNTHRMFSRNSASSRAIPTAKFLQKIEEDPAIPVYFGGNRSGMQAADELTGVDRACAEDTWLKARNDAVRHVRRLQEIGLHKQIANRLLENWLFTSVIVSATEWENFFALRCHKDAQPEIQAVADAALWQYVNHEPVLVQTGEWHLPFGDRFIGEGWTEDEKKSVSVARCARVSYQTFDGEIDLQKDLDLVQKLAASGHMSPFEHVATPAWDPATVSGNFKGWRQWRKSFAGENRSVDLKALLARRIEQGNKFANSGKQEEPNV